MYIEQLYTIQSPVAEHAEQGKGNENQIAKKTIIKWCILWRLKNSSRTMDFKYFQKLCVLKIFQDALSATYLQPGLRDLASLMAVLDHVETGFFSLTFFLFLFLMYDNII